MTISFPYSSAPVRQIREIQFGVMSPEEIVSVVSVYFSMVVKVIIPVVAKRLGDMDADITGTTSHGYRTSADTIRKRTR